MRWQPAALTCLLAMLVLSGGASASASTGCQLDTPAFCDSFDRGPAEGAKSGDLNPARWHVTRINPAYQFAGNWSLSSYNEFPAVPVPSCRRDISTVIAPNDTIVCDTDSPHAGQVMTAIMAQFYGLYSLRPNQAFDFAGRMGKIVFDVDAATGGGLDKWISVYVTDQPVNGANSLQHTTGLQPRNGLGVEFAVTCGTSYQQVGVSNVFTYANHEQSTAFAGDNTGPCVKTSKGSLNHFEIRLSEHQVDVWGSDFSSDNDNGGSFPNFRLLQSVPLSLSFSRGYVHFQTGIRAPLKYADSMGLDTPYAQYFWDNLGFDGPVIAPERVYQIDDALTAVPNGGKNLGYKILDGGGMFTCCEDTRVASLPIQGVDLANATAAYLSLDAYLTPGGDFNAETFALEYRINGGVWKSPLVPPAYAAMVHDSTWWSGLVLPIPLSDLRQGGNTLELTTVDANKGYPVVVSNIYVVISTAGAATTSEYQQTIARAPLAERPTGLMPTSAGCQLQTADQPANIAFCDTFEQPMGTGNRSGDLNGTVWGVSRTSGNVNQGQGVINGWSPTNLEGCAGTMSVAAPADIHVCDGQLRQAVNDDGNVTLLAMYPKQPFDFAGRTGTVGFDVSNDSGGTHSAWPELWITDMPVPAPFVFSGGAWRSIPRHGFGIRLGAVTRPGQGPNMGPNCPADDNWRWTVDSVVVVRDYAMEEVNLYGNGDGLRLSPKGCVIASNGPNGGLNHVEVRVAQNQIDVYASDAGTTEPLKQIATISNANLTFSRGLIWINDAHYNANKGAIPQAEHTFTWDNVAFDGPFTYRDYSFDALDMNELNQYGSYNLGQYSLPPQTVKWNVLGLPKPGTLTADVVRVLFNFHHYDAPSMLTVTVNGHAHGVPWPYPDRDGWTWRTLAVEVPIADLVEGTNEVTIGADAFLATSNVNIVFVNGVLH